MGISLVCILGLLIAGGWALFKRKLRREGAKEATDSINRQEQEQKSNADDELAKSNAENATKSNDSKFKWLRKYASIKNQHVS
jgi:type II secretory pathway pseudopilin PulG